MTLSPFPLIVRAKELSYVESVGMWPLAGISMPMIPWNRCDLAKESVTSKDVLILFVMLIWNMSGDSCDEGYIGQSCECNVQEDKDTIFALEKKCINPNSSLPCSGHGICLCGKCICKGHLKGQYCQCDDTSCNRHNNIVCGGKKDLEGGSNTNPQQRPWFLFSYRYPPFFVIAEQLTIHLCATWQETESVTVAHVSAMPTTLVLPVNAQHWLTSATQVEVVFVATMETADVTNASVTQVSLGDTARRLEAIVSGSSE